MVFMLCGIDGSARSIDRGSVDGSVVSATIDRSRKHRLIYGWSCSIDHPSPSIDACTVRHVDH